MQCPVFPLLCLIVIFIILIRSFQYMTIYIRIYQCSKQQFLDLIDEFTQQQIQQIKMSEKKNIMKGLNMIKKVWTESDQFNKLITIATKISEMITSMLKKDLNSIDQFQNHQSYKLLLDGVSKLTLSFQNYKEIIKPIFNLNKIFYHHIKQQSNFSMVIISIPQGLEFSLHNHPQMLVFTKCIYGTILAQSMDIAINKFPIEKLQYPLPQIKEIARSVESQTIQQLNLQKNQQNGEKRKQGGEYNKYKQEQLHYKQISESISQIKIENGNVHKVTNWQSRILESGDFEIIMPKKKNIHRLVGKTNSIFLDILIPDYNQTSDYKTYEYVNFGKDKKQELKIREIFNPKEAPYLMSFQQMLE